MRNVVSGRWSVVSGRLDGRARRAKLAVAVVCIVLAGCGYRLVGAAGAGAIPARLQKLHSVPFGNQTTRAELDQRLTEAISQEWVRRGRFQLVSSPDQADAVLTGTITSAAVSPVRFDAQGRATEYQLTVSMDVQFVDRTGPKPVVLWHDQKFTRVLSYEVDASLTNYFDREVQAIEQLSGDLARGLVVTILEGF
jgi:outer membrane lipopolysaccharide assembly protein LptE/RlpB